MWRMGVAALMGMAAGWYDGRALRAVFRPDPERGKAMIVIPLSHFELAQLLLTALLVYVNVKKQKK
jgi:hypothetical protein